MTARAGRLASHTTILMGMELGVRFLDALISVFLARYLAPEGFGLLAFALSFAWLFSILPGAGMWSLSTRDVARSPDQLSRYLSNGLCAKALLAALTCLVMWITTLTPGFQADKRSFVMLAGWLMILETTVKYTLSFFQAAQRMTMVAMVSLGLRLGWTLSSIAVMLWHGGVADLLVARVAVTIVWLIASVVLIEWKLQRITWSVDLGFIWRMLQASWPFALFYLYGTVYADLSTVVLSAMRGDIVTGWFAAGQKVLRLLVFIPNGFFGALLPAMSRASSNARPQLISTLARSCKYLLLIGLPIAGGAWVVAEPVVAMLYGPSYHETVQVLQVLSWSIPLTFLNWALAATVMAVNQERRGSAYLLVGVVCCAIGNLLTVPRWGVLGASVSSVIAEAAVLAVQLELVHRVLPEARPLAEVARPLAATAVMMAVAWTIRWLPLPLLIAASAMVYVAALIAVRAVGREEWSLLAGMLRLKASPESS